MVVAEEGIDADGEGLHAPCARDFAFGSRGGVEAPGCPADGVPSRDLLISPDHALLVDGIRVAAQALVNDVSILCETISEEKLVYHHTEAEQINVRFTSTSGLELIVGSSVAVVENGASKYLTLRSIRVASWVMVRVFSHQ